MSEFLGLDSLIDTPEDLPESAESADYVAYDLMTPGNYLSQSRTITARKKDDGSITYQVSFDSGLENPEGQVFGKGNYPEKTWLSNKPFVRQNRPGKTSSVMDYLRACNFDPKKISSIASALEQSQSIPVQVYVGWEDRTEKQEDGTYPKPTLKTKDFNVGTKDQPMYTPVVTKDGTTYTARHRVSSSFRKVS